MELTANYKSGNFAAYGNLARTVSLAKEVISGQFNFEPDELAYIANHWVHTDHDQLYTASGGVSYIWRGTKFTTDATFGSGLRSGFANTDHVASSTSVNLGAGRSSCWGARPLSRRALVINVLDKINPIRAGTGIGVFAPQYGPRIGFFGGLASCFDGESPAIIKIINIRRSTMQEVHMALEALKFGGAMVYPLVLLAVLAVVIMLDKAFVYWRYVRFPEPLLELFETFDVSLSDLDRQSAGLDRRNYFLRFFQVVIATAPSRSGG